jgi:hypothetical protein
LLSTVLYSLEYVLAEQVLHASGNESITGPQLCSYVGMHPRMCVCVCVCVCLCVRVCLCIHFPVYNIWFSHQLINFLSSNGGCFIFFAQVPRDRSCSYAT